MKIPNINVALRIDTKDRGIGGVDESFCVVASQLVFILNSTHFHASLEIVMFQKAVSNMLLEKKRTIIRTEYVSTAFLRLESLFRAQVATTRAVTTRVVTRRVPTIRGATIRAVTTREVTTRVRKRPHTIDPSEICY